MLKRMIGNAFSVSMREGLELCLVVDDISKEWDVSQ